MILLPVLALTVASAVLLSIRLARRPLPSSSPISARADRMWRKGVLIAAIAVAVLGNIPFIGLPGFGWLELVYPAVRAMTSWPMGRFESNASWPSAMMITALWPASFIPAYGLARLGRSPAGLVGTTTAGVAMIAVCGLVLALAMIALYFTW